MNRLYRNIALGVKTLWLHKLRSMLTMLGVVFGVASVVSMLAVGEGASAEALARIRSLGAQNILIESVKPREDQVQGNQRARTNVYGLKYADAERIQSNFSTLSKVVPVKSRREEAWNGSRNFEVRLVGTTPDWFDVVPREVLSGRVLMARDQGTLVDPVVITERVARELLPADEPIGSYLRFGQQYFQVIGVIAGASSVGGIDTPDEDNDAYIPLHVYKSRYGDMNVQRRAGSFEREEVELNQLLLEVDSTDNVEKTADAVESLLDGFHERITHKINVPRALLREAEATAREFNIVLGSIAGISLLVGGIGIMNIMLASVTERTREIGIRRAIGAKKQHIIVQFLVETLVLTLVGGFIGIGFGMAIPQIVTAVMGMPTVITVWSLLLAAGISVGVGVVFGLYPAVRAASLDPIVALRHE